MKLAIITDIHLKESNLETATQQVVWAIDEAVKLGLSSIVIAGDILHTRKAQTIGPLVAFVNILDYAYTQGVVLEVIPGNHDKVNYSSEQSYLDVFASHPAIRLTTAYSYRDEGDVRIHMIPFFNEKTIYPEYLKRVQLGKKKNILITHIAIDGVKANGGYTVDETFATAHFSDFDLVIVGHYHDRQRVGDNIWYIGSLYQDNYGEDPHKGMTVLDTNTMVPILMKSTFKEFKTITFNANELLDSDIESTIKKYSNSADHIRFKVTGSREELVKLDRSALNDVGIDVKLDTVVDVADVEAATFKKLDIHSIKEEWKVWSEKRNFDVEEGLKLIEI